MPTPPEATERRGFSRVTAELGVELRCGDGLVLRARLRNLSVQGLLLSCERSPAIGAACEARLLDPGTPGAPIEARGSVVRAVGEQFALHIDELPYESYETLRALLLARASDASALADELADRLGRMGLAAPE